MERDYEKELCAHIDQCERCKKGPLDTCVFGDWLLMRAATQIEHARLKPTPTPEAARAE